MPSDPKAPPGDGNGASRRPDDGPGFTVHDRRFWVTGEGAEEGDAAVARAAPRQPSYVEQLTQELEAARQDAAEKDQRLREYIAAYKEQVVHGLEETKERLKRDAEKELQLARGELVTGLLEVLDNLQRSAQAVRETRNLDALLDGLTLVEAQFLGKLGALGLERVPAAAGQPFDPARHEAVAVVPVTDPAQDMHVVNELQAGYVFGDRVLRPARVVVGKLAS
ncbi:MAG TPA: nucleotide exchange factor GrpE [Polyangia bacterium]|jgi:molecular chaperone GrpE (heat shock protein)